MVVKIALESREETKWIAILLSSDETESVATREMATKAIDEESKETQSIDKQA